MRLLNRYTGNTIFECECNSIKDCVLEAVKQKIPLVDVDLHNSDLRGVKLFEVNLRNADLHDAIFNGADLYGAKFKGACLRDEKLTKNPVYINAGFLWEVWITDKHIKIGCQIHPTEAWEKFTDEQISEIDVDALDFWKVWKRPILEMAKAHQGG